MLHRDPKKRPSLVALKNDPFFKGPDSIDWGKLARREVKPPVILTPSLKSTKASPKDDLELLFENDDSSQLRGAKPLFEDEDYEEHNKRFNRVKSYSFSIGKPR